MEEQRTRIASYLNRLHGYALSLAGDRDRARDLVQDCVLRAISARRRPSDEPAYRAWLFRILRNAFLDEQRRAGNGHTIEDPEGRAANGADIWHFDENLISGLTVRIGLSRLSTAHREVIVLVDLAGFSYSETAALIGIPQGTVMSRLSRARQCLLQAISENNVQPLPTRTRPVQTRKAAK